MAYQLVILRRAEHDIQRIRNWISERSRPGADRWLAAFDTATQNLLDHPEGYGLAYEDDLVEDTLRQFLFKTRRGRTYRGVFVVVDDEVRILRVRGPGQAPLEPDEMA